MPRIEYFYSLMSPFTYLAGMGLEEIAASHSADIVYRPADIGQVLAQTGGLPVPKRHPARQEYRLQELKRLSAMNNKPLNFQPKFWPVDATPASCAVLAVLKAGGNAGILSHAFLRACWAEDRDISDHAVIADILHQNNCSLPMLQASLDDARADFDANTQAALEQGVFGAPFYIVDGTERFWGQDRLGHLDWHLGQIS